MKYYHGGDIKYGFVSEWTTNYDEAIMYAGYDENNIHECEAPECSQKASKIAEETYNDLMNDFECGKLSASLDEICENIVDFEQFCVEFDVDDIVNTAGLWDSPAFSDWFYEKYMFDAVIVNNGMIKF